VLLASPAAADSTDTANAAAAVLVTRPLYVSSQAESLGIAAPVPSASADATQPRIAVVSEDEGNAGQLAAQIKAQLGSAAQTVGVALVTSHGVADFHAVSDSTSFCKGGADYAAQQVLEDVSGTRPTPEALLQAYEKELAKLPPDRGESSCASALAHHDNNDAKAWLWLLLVAVIGVLGIGAFAIYVRRTVRARGEQPVRENLPQWITEDDAPDDEHIDDEGNSEEKGSGDEEP
jgi:hypothetical protein